MALSFQLDLFEKNDILSLVEKKLSEMEEQNANLRRGAFARLTNLSAIVTDLNALVMKQQEEIDTLKKLQDK